MKRTTAFRQKKSKQHTQRNQTKNSSSIIIYHKLKYFNIFLIL